MAQTQTFAEFLSDHFGGVLRHGTHEANGQACALEALNAYHGRPWTDDPAIARIWDLRPLNDAPWLSNTERTAHLLPLLQAYDGCLDWPRERQRAVMERIVVETVRQLVSGLPGLSAEVRQLCRACDDLDGAIRGARGAYAEASTKFYGAGFGTKTAARYGGARTAARGAGAAARYTFSTGGAVAAGTAAAGTAVAVAAVDADAAHRTSSRAVLVTACDIWLAAAVKS